MREGGLANTRGMLAFFLKFTRDEETFVPQPLQGSGPFVSFQAHAVRAGESCREKPDTLDSRRQHPGRRQHHAINVAQVYRKTSNYFEANSYVIVTSDPTRAGKTDCYFGNLLVSEVKAVCRDWRATGLEVAASN